MKIKRFFCLCVAFALAFSAQAHTSRADNMLPKPFFNITGSIDEEKYKPNDEVTFIVEVEGDPVFASDQAAAVGTDYIHSSEGQIKENNLINAQARVMSAINEEVSSQLSLEARYTMLFNGFAIKSAYKNMADILNIPGVKNVYISENIQFEPHLSASVEMSGALPSELTPYTGAGQVVAVIDTEFNINHDFFKAEPLEPKYTKDTIAALIQSKNLSAQVNANEVYVSSKIPFAYDYCNDSYDVYSTNNIHGTHVAGIIGGKNGTGADGSAINGVAPECQLILMKITSKDGTINTSCALEALDDAVKLGVSAVNCSFGMDYVSPDLNPVMKQYFVNARNAGVFISASAGNEARGFYQKAPLTQNIDYSAISAPASISGTMAVASVNKASAGTGAISSFSSYGVAENLELKPEITAPGGSIYSSVPNNSYAAKSGTSMAAPHISGVALLINEYLDKTGSATEGTARIDLIENLMMSTADVAYQSSSNVPYSPRLQGAGIVNAAAAVSTPVILKGDTAKTKISLGDGLADKFSIKFTAENLSPADVTYDKISLNVLTDGYTSSGGKYYVSGSRALTIPAQTLPESVTLKANSSAQITAEITLDSQELGELKEVFTNGFFIDGFIRLEKQDETLPGLGIPFTGFYGDWTKANAFDTTIYDDGGSTLVAGDKGVGGTLLYTLVDTSTNVLGFNGTDGYNDDYIAISPNADGISDVLRLQLTPMRTLSQINADVINQNGLSVSKITLNGIYNKFYSQALLLDDISSVADGDYTLRLTGLYNYQKTNPTEHILEIPFYADTQVPEILKAVPNGDTLSVTFRDNKHLEYVYTYYEDNLGQIHSDVKYIANPAEGGEVTVSFSLSDISAQGADYEDVYIYAFDKARNYYGNSVSALMGDIHPVISDFTYTGEILSVSFDIMSYKSIPGCTLVLAFYDATGALVYAEADENITIAKGAGSHKFSGYADLSEASECRLFIWGNMQSLTPADLSKAFDVSAELAQ